MFKIRFHGGFILVLIVVLVFVFYPRTIATHLRACQCSENPRTAFLVAFCRTQGKPIWGMNQCPCRRFFYKTNLQLESLRELPIRSPQNGHVVFLGLPSGILWYPTTCPPNLGQMDNSLEMLIKPQSMLRFFPTLGMGLQKLSFFATTIGSETAPKNTPKNMSNNSAVTSCRGIQVQIPRGMAWDGSELSQRTVGMWVWCN